MLEQIIENTTEYICQMPKSVRKRYGQFFTSKETARYMAGLFEIPQGKEKLQILDAGSGSGILAVALLERLEKEQHINAVRLVCYETDDNIISLLKKNLEEACLSSRLHIDFEVRTDNYILSQYLEYNQLLGANPFPDKFDLVIGNPPYLKISKNAPEAKAMQDVCYGAPNLYFLFASMGSFNLKSGGEMVYIIPRSWTSGAYFEKFRKKFLDECVIKHLHLFVSRDKVFDKEKVLQETLIIKVKKSSIEPKFINVTTTESCKDFSNLTHFKAPYRSVVSPQNRYVYLVTSEEDSEILDQINVWNNTLPAIGLPMKTGLTVDFRNRDMLRDVAGEHTVPLFYSQHIKEGKVIFPIGKNNEFIADTREGLLQNNVNYLFVKRFTAKEENRRLQSGVYLSRLHPDYKLISTQNKINFIGGVQQLSECVIYGLYVIFNSTYYDRYYRILNGSTQVNSTEINSMPVPPLSIIEAMGKKLINKKDTSEQTCDEILRGFLYEEIRRSKKYIKPIASAG